MKSILKVALASTLVANSALAMNFVAGGSVGMLGNQIKMSSGSNSSKTNLSSFQFGLEGGALFDLTDSFAMSSEVFLAMNTLSTKKEDFGFEIKQGLSFGVQTRAIYSVMENAKLYGKVGVGMMKMSYDVASISLSKNSAFAKLGFGMDFMLTETMSMFSEFEYSMPFSKLEDEKKYGDFNVKMQQYGIKVGVRYFF